jgi:hypothetical protein
MNAERRSGRLPPGYPAQYEQEVMLGDGRRVLIRPILPSDHPNWLRRSGPLILTRCTAGSWVARPARLLRCWST